MKSLLALLLLCGSVSARDLGQWDATDQDVREWFQHLMQPDNPRVSCCGESDAYWADSFEVQGDQYIAIITDERDLPNRPHVDVGTKVLIPNYKLKFDEGNPTGHGVIFYRPGDGYVFCYLPPGGV